MKRLNIPLITIVILLLSCASSAEKKDPPENSANRELIYHAFKQWRQGTGNFFDLLDDNTVWTVTGSGMFSGTYKDKQDFLDNAVIPINKQLDSKITPELTGITAEGKTVWLHWKGTARTKRGTIYTNEYAWKLQLENGKIIKVTAFLDNEALDQLFTENKENMKTTMEESKEYIGMWVTGDGYIRHELLPGNRYDEARGNRKSAYRGSYEVTGNHIDYKDDTSFTADGEFKDGVLYHAGMILYKE